MKQKFLLGTIGSTKTDPKQTPLRMPSMQECCANEHAKEMGHDRALQSHQTEGPHSQDNDDGELPGSPTPGWTPRTVGSALMLLSTAVCPRWNQMHMPSLGSANNTCFCVYAFFHAS